MLRPDKSLERTVAKCIALAAIPGAIAPAVARTDDGRGHVATWVHEGEQRSYFVSLNAAGECSIALRDRTTGDEFWRYCTYWVHGSRINFREWKVNSTRHLLPIQAEYIPQSDVLILNGEEEPPLRRIGNVERQ